MQYRPEIDGLRALSVLPVILFHAGFHVFSGGFVGVDVFFVISGYLITTILIQELGQNRFSLLKFYERRMRRIFPALFLVMVVTIPISWVLFTPADLKSYWNSLVAVSLFFSNFLFWTEAGYFGSTAELKPLLHTWSMAVEEQYYIAFPVFLMLFWRYGSRLIFVLLAVVILFSLGLAEWWSLRNPSTAFYLLPTRAWEILAGAIAAIYLSQKKDHKSSDILAGLGLGLVFLSIFTFDNTVPFPGFYAIVPVAGAVLVVLYANRDNAVGQFLARPILIWIGLISYSAYLWHQPLFAFTRYQFGHELDWPVAILLVLVTFALAAASWKFVEQPFRRKDWISGRKLTVISGIFLLFFITTGTVGNWNEGARYFLSVHQKQVLKNADFAPTRSECHTGGSAYLKPQNACRYNHDQAGGKPVWAVFGDSHSVELAYAVGQEMSDKDVEVIHLSFSGCYPDYGPESSSSDCARWTKDAVEMLIGDDRVTHVVLGYRLFLAFYGSQTGIYPDLPNDVAPELREHRWQSLLLIIRDLQKAGKQVVLSSQAPELPMMLHDLVVENPDMSDRLKGVSRKWWDARSAFLIENEKDLPSDVIVIRPEKRFCDKTSCFAVLDGEPLYFDNNHISVQGGRIIARQIREQILMGNSASP